MAINGVNVRPGIFFGFCLEMAQWPLAQGLHLASSKFPKNRSDLHICQKILLKFTAETQEIRN